jgi:hypothetical protein
VCIAAIASSSLHVADYVILAPPTAANMGSDLKDTAAPQKVRLLLRERYEFGLTHD